MDFYRIAEQAKEYVSSFFHSHRTPKLAYHDITHTKDVVAATNQIATHYQLNDIDSFIVTIAAWFHDTGYYVNVAQHEQKSTEIAEAFLKEKKVDGTILETIKKCILATKMPQKPTTKLEEIACDADLFHLGTDNFDERNKLLRKEAQLLLGKKISKDDWRSGTIRFLESHKFHTDYCRSLLNAKKKQHLEKLKAKNAEAGISTETVIPSMFIEPHTKPAEAAADAKPVKKKSDRPERGIETMFRIGSGNNQRLSDMADTKAHIMISVNSIIISVLLSVLFRKIEEYPNLAFPAILLLTVSLVTIVFSILATRPKIPRGTFTQQDIEERRVNLLFFGNYFRMNYDDYASGMMQVMEDRSFLYGTLIRDVYAQGVVLGKKYRWLTASYNVFMYGLVASVVAFVVASFFY